MNRQFPFKPGSTLHGGTPTDTVGQEKLLGAEFEYRDPNSGRRTVYRAVRNVSGGALLPKFPVKFKSTSTYIGTEVDGYQSTNTGDWVIVDPDLPAAGAANNDIFFVVVEGFTTSRTPNSFVGPAIAVGDFISAATHAATQSVTLAGMYAITAANTELAAAVMLNCHARAIEARTTGETGSDLDIEILRS